MYVYILIIVTFCIYYCLTSSIGSEGLRATVIRLTFSLPGMCCWLNCSYVPIYLIYCPILFCCIVM